MNEDRCSNYSQLYAHVLLYIRIYVYCDALYINIIYLKTHIHIPIKFTVLDSRIKSNVICGVTTTVH